MPSKITLQTRQQLWRKQGGTCPWCWQPVPYDALVNGEATVDHRRPKSHGGTNAFVNLQIMHWVCNQEKGDSCEGCDFCAPVGDRIIDLSLGDGHRVRYRLVTEPEYHGQLIAQALLAKLRSHGAACRCKMCVSLTPEERAFIGRLPYPGELS